MPSLLRSKSNVVVAIGVALVLAACGSDSPTDPAPRGDEPLRTLTVDASAEGVWGYADLQGDTALLMTIADPNVSADWVFGFSTTKVKLNGGAAGPGGVTAYCICQNSAVSDEELQTLTPESELDDFEAVNAADIPATETAWSATVFDAAPWYRYDLAGNHHIWPTYEVYLIRGGNETYKVQLVNYYGPAGETRQITFRYSNLGD